MQLQGDLQGLDEVAEILQLGGLGEMDAVGLRRFRDVVRARIAKKGPFTGRHAALLNGLDDLSDAELAGLGSKLKKAVKKIGKTVKKVAKKAGEATAKVAKVIPAAALVIPTKDALKNAAKSTAIFGAAAGAASLLPAGAAGKAVMSVVDGQAEQAPAMPVQYTGGGQGGPIEGEYLAAGEPDQVPNDGQWVAGFDNRTVLLLAGAGGLTLLLAILVTRRKKRERMRYAAAA